MAKICNFCGSLKQSDDGMLQTDSFNSHFLEIAAKHFWFSEEELKSFSICHLCWEKLLDFHKFYCQVEKRFLPKVNAVKKESTPAEIDANCIKIEPLDIKTEVDHLETGIPITEADSEVEQSDNDENSDDQTPDDVPPHKLITDKDVLLFCQMQCPYCSEQFEEYDLFRLHCRLVHRQRGYVTCCDSQFNYFSKLQEHIFMHIDPNCFRCKLCDSNLTSMRNLIRHQKEIHPADGVKTYDCQLCTEKFSARYMLNDHVKFTHSNDKKIECPQCLKRFINAKQLAGHIRYKHTPDGEVVCDICSKVFTGKGNLERHRSLHTTTRVNCPICEKSLKNEWVLKKHLKCHREASMNIKCSFCDRHAPNLHALRQHVQAAHSEEKQLPAYKCPTCDKTFKRKWCLNSHIRVHTGEMPFSCDICDKKFRTSANLYGHRKVHHPENFRKAKLPVTATSDVALSK